MIETIDSSLSRNDIIQWINETLKLNLSKIEQLGTGAVHCQLLDMVYPTKVPLHKVNWRAKFEYEYVYNFKILQQSFTRFNIPKLINVEKLVKAKYQDNLEFAQWMLKFVQTNFTGIISEYDAVARRGNVETDFALAEKAVAITKSSLTKDLSKSSIIKSNKTAGIPMPKNFLLGSNSKSGSLGGMNQSNSNSFSNLYQGLSQKDADTLADITNFLDRQKIDVEKSPLFETVRSERDFYYSKLRDIDHVLDVFKGNDAETLIKSIREILYLLPEDKAIVCEDGTVKIKPRENEDIIMKDEITSKKRINDSQMVIEDSGNLLENLSQPFL